MPLGAGAFSSDSILAVVSSKSECQPVYVRDTLLGTFSPSYANLVCPAYEVIVGRAEGEFHTLEELKARTQLGKSLIEMLKEHGVLDGIPETNQLTLF